MIDIHSHILSEVPGDDGAVDLEQSVAIAEKLVSAGFHTVFATPHCIEGEGIQNFDALRFKCVVLNETLRIRNIPLQTYLGAEIYFHNEITARLKTGRAIPLGDSPYVLIELPLREFPETVSDVVDEMIKAGYWPIIAHPERNREISANPQLLVEAVRRGAYCQLNLCSLTGVYGSAAQKTAEGLLKAGLYHFVGSDLHRPNLNLTDALSALKKQISTEYHHQLTVSSGEMLLKGHKVIHETNSSIPKAVIKASEVKNKEKPQKLGKVVLISIAMVGILTSGALAFADYKIQKEMEAAFASAGIDPNGELDLEKLMGSASSQGNIEVTNQGSASSTGESSGGTNSGANQGVNGDTTETGSSEETASGQDSTTGNTDEAANKPKDKVTATASSSLKKLSLADKARAYSIVMGKLSPDMVSKLKELAAGGFTSEEKQEVKAIFYSNFTAEEQEFLMSLYRKGK